MNRTEKQQEIDRLREEFGAAQSAYLVEFSGLTVEQANDLRCKLRDASGKYRVVKNRLAIRAIEGTALGSQAELFDGPTAVAYGAGDPVVMAKVLADFQKTTSIKVKGMLLEGRPLPAKALDGIVNLPSRPELISTFAGMLRSPLIKFLQLLKAPVRDFASVLRQVAEKKGAGGEGPAS